MTVKKAAPKTTPKAPSFGEVGYEFLVKAKIANVSDDKDEYPFNVKVDMGAYVDWYSDGEYMVFQYPTKESFTEFVYGLDPKLAKQVKQDELKKAQQLVAKLQKELDSL